MKPVLAVLAALLLSAAPALALSVSPYIKGAYVLDDGIGSFQQCGDDKVMVLDGPEVEMKLLAANARFVSERSGRPRTPIWITISVEPYAPRTGVPENYDGVMRLTELLSLSWANADDCELPLRIR